jgi:hypothetical protein
MAFDRRTLRGALAGAVAAGVWMAQQPLDKQALGSRYDDVELLGKALTRRRAWPALGAALHVANGALFGAVYAQVAPLVPLPPWSRGPLAGLVEHTGLWPLVGVLDRVHPARGELEPLAGNRRALGLAVWRHLLFGTVLGELERRLNAEPDAPSSPYEGLLSTNGYGSLEHVDSIEPAS